MTTVTPTAGEYEAATNGCGVVDRSERGKLALSGAEAKEFLQGQVSNDVLALHEGIGCYAALLTPKGKMRGDLRILDAGDELLLDTERVALQDLFNTIRRFSIGYDTELHKRTLERGLLSLVGPETDTILDGAFPPSVEHAHVAVELDGIPVRAIRTDLGADLLVDADRTAELSALLAGRSAAPISEATAEVLRVESGRPRYGVDLDDSVIPQEAGLNARAVSFTKGCYVGQETVARLFYRGKPNRTLRGLIADAPLTAGSEVLAGERRVGTVSSAATSPRLGQLGLALIRREIADGDRVSAGGVAARVTPLPFSG